jgi:hypothetical protein
MLSGQASEIQTRVFELTEQLSGDPTSTSGPQDGQYFWTAGEGGRSVEDLTRALADLTKKAKELQDAADGTDFDPKDLEDPGVESEADPGSPRARRRRGDSSPSGRQA